MRHQAASTIYLVVSGDVMWDGGRMACWSSIADAAEAKKAEVASVSALLKPMPPFLTGRDACSHCLSSSSTLKIEDNPVLSMSSNLRSVIIIIIILFIYF